MSNVERKYQTGYVLATETAEGSNTWELFVGKAGAQGNATFTFSLNADRKSFTIVDTRTGDESQYFPKLMNKGETVPETDAAKIAYSAVDQIVKRFLVEKEVKAVKAKEPKAPKEKKVKEPKAPKEKKAKASKKDLPAEAADLLLDSVDSATEMETPVLAEGEQAVLVGARKFAFETKDRGPLVQVIVEASDGKKLTTTIGKNDDPMVAVNELASRMAIEYIG